MTDSIKKTLSQILSAFGYSGINSKLEIILIKETGSYINLNVVYSETDLKRLCLVSVCRDCCKTQRYRYPSINNDFHKRNLEKLNKALGTKFNKGDMEIIYQYFGNGLNQDLAISFVVSGYDMNIFKEVQNEHRRHYRVQ